MCGFLGIITQKGKASFELYNGLKELQHRGQDSAGFVTYDSLTRNLYRKR